jgi:hypothetical protein
VVGEREVRAVSVVAGVRAVSPIVKPYPCKPMQENRGESPALVTSESDVG